MVDNYYERFQKRNNQKEISVDWIDRSINKIQIKKGNINNQGELVVDNTLAYDAVHIFRDKEGPDNAILYTYRDDGFDIGDLIVKQSFDRNGQELIGNRETFILFEETPRVDSSVDIRVFSTIEANAILKERDGTYFPAYFKGEMRSESDVSFTLRANLATMESVSLAIVPRKQFHVLNKHVITEVKSFKSGESSYFSWAVKDTDDISTTGMQYVTLKKILREPEATIIDDKEEVEDPTTPISRKEIRVNTTQEIETYSGYFKPSREVNIVKRTARLVTFLAPIIPGELVITVKDADGAEQTIDYMVVI